MNKEYSPETRERALRTLAETRPSHPTMMSTVRHVAGLLGMSPETLRLWQRRYEIDAGVKPGVATEATAEVKRLQRENAELRKANEILKAAGIFFAKVLDYPSTRLSGSSTSTGIVSGSSSSARCSDRRWEDSSRPAASTPRRTARRRPGSCRTIS